MRPKPLVPELREYAVHCRRWLHRHAELSMEERETTAFITSELNKLGIPYIQPGATGAIGVIEGRGPGRVIGLRADCDALPVREETGRVFCSRNDGVMHACGHDFHTACLLTAARILWEQRDRFDGTVKLIFQPGEELGGAGALSLLEGGDLDDCGAFAAIHVTSGLPTGAVSVQPGLRKAAASDLYITIKGKGGHGAQPWKTVDPVVTAAAVIMNLQPLLTQELDRRNMAIANIGVVRADALRGDIPETLTMEGALRYYDPEMEHMLREAITRIVENTCATYRATCEVKVIPGSPALANDPELCRLGRKAAARVWGEENLLDLPCSLGNEGFSYYGQRTGAPLLFVPVGAGNPEKACDYPSHHPCFDVDEDALDGAASFFAEFALDYLVGV